MQNDVESSLLLDECRCYFVWSRPLPCQSISSWVFLVFLSYAHIRGVPVSDIWCDPFFAHDQNTAFAVAVCDLLRPGVDQPNHTPLYTWSCLCELLLKQDISNTRNLFSCVCMMTAANLYTIRSHRWNFQTRDDYLVVAYRMSLPSSTFKQHALEDATEWK